MTVTPSNGFRTRLCSLPKNRNKVRANCSRPFRRIEINTGHIISGHAATFICMTSGEVTDEMIVG